MALFFLAPSICIWTLSLCLASAYLSPTCLGLIIQFLYHIHTYSIFYQKIYIYEEYCAYTPQRVENSLKYMQPFKLKNLSIARKGCLAERKLKVTDTA